MNLEQEKILNQNLLMSPVSVQFEITEKCNLQCKFCYNSQQPVVCTNYREIIQRLVDENVMGIIITGGEPTLHPDFMKIVELCSLSFVKVQVQTNGIFLTKEIAKDLERLGIHSVNVSLHGSEFTNDRLTGVSGSYRAALAGIKNMLSTNVLLATNFVLTSENIFELPSHVDFMYDLGVKSFTLTRFTPTGIGRGSVFLEPSKKDLLNALEYANNKYTEDDTLSFLLANSIPRCVLPSHLKNHCNYCHYGSSRFYVDANGNLLMCGMSRVKIGNILENSIKEIKEQSQVYKNHVVGDSVPISCKSCADFHKCRGGCRAAALASSGSFSGKDPLVCDL
jgi:radical SAM protein with 4Fe4S-binding SPASM domain